MLICIYARERKISAEARMQVYLAGICLLFNGINLARKVLRSLFKRLAQSMLKRCEFRCAYTEISAQSFRAVTGAEGLFAKFRAPLFAVLSPNRLSVLSSSCAKALPTVYRKQNR